MKKKKRYSAKKIGIAIVLLLTIIFTIVFFFKKVKPLKTIEEVSVPFLSSDEKRALVIYNNVYHLEVAQQNGFSEPFQSKTEIESNFKKYKSKFSLVKIEDNKHYEVPHLTNSSPYLKAEAKDFLELVGTRFEKSLKELEIRPYRYSVTSILRTLEDQKALRKTNVNATQNNSSHYYGLTFDLSQTRFFERGNSAPIYSYRLRNILLRDLIQLQSEGKCYVILENQTKCIHVTVR